MTQHSNGSETGMAIIVAAIILALYLEPTSSFRVQEFRCEAEISTGQCKGKMTKVGRLKFVVNAHTKSVAVVVLDGQDSWWLGSVHSDCAVVDADNWQCGRIDAGEQLQMVGGDYSRRSGGIGGIGSYHIAGLVGWRHWLSYLGMNLKPSWPSP